ncbi:MAG: hypothetical protein ABIJ09_17565 [Pseudomonadota bacterium]
MARCRAWVCAAGWLALVACPAVAPRDAGHLDAASLDAASLDTASLDAAGGADTMTQDAGPGLDLAPISCPEPPLLVPPCPVLDVDGLPPGDAIRPNQTVTVSARPLLDGPWPAGAQVSWRVLQAPPLSRITLWPADAAETTLLTQPGARVGMYRLGIDRVGRYLLETTLQADTGAPIVLTCELRVVAPPGLYVEASQEVDTISTSLLMVRADGQQRYCLPQVTQDWLAAAAPAQWCTDDDGVEDTCFGGNCSDFAAAWPDWDSDSTRGSAGDPRLVLSDLPAHFPDAIWLQHPVSGTYLVAAIPMAGASPTLPSLKVDFRLFVGGVLLATVPTMASPRVLDGALELTWPDPGSPGPCVTVLATQEHWCLAGLDTLCLGCGTDRSCGPGTTCEATGGACQEVAEGCGTGAGCGTHRVCVPASQTCASTLCSQYWRCPELDQTCSEDTLSCSDPFATCPGDVDEPNDDLATAQPLVTSLHEDLLCRGNDDFFWIPVQANTRLRAVIEMQSLRHEATGTWAGLYALDGTELQSVTSEHSVGIELRLATNIRTDGELVLGLRGRATTLTQIPYTIQLVEDPPLYCDQDPGEPNDTLSQAGNARLAEGEHALMLCGVNDVDHYLLTLPANRQLRSVLYSEATCGALHQQLFTAQGLPTEFHADGPAGEELLWRAAGDSDESLILQVARTLTVDADQAYQLAIEYIDCQDGHEPNDTLEQAVSVGSGTVEGSICGPEDADQFVIETEIGGDLTIGLAATGSGAVRAEFWDPNLSLPTPIGPTTTSGEEVTLQLQGLRSERYRVVVMGPGDSAPVDRTPYALRVVVGGRLDGGSGCGDPYEQNDSLATPADIEPGSLQANICHGGDVDYFRFTAPSTSQLSVNVHEQLVNVVVFDLLDNAGQLIAHSSVFGPMQHLELPSLAAGTYLLRLAWSGEGAEPVMLAYDLSVFLVPVADAGAGD